MVNDEKHIIKEYLINLKNNSNLAPRLNDDIRKNLDNINKVCARIMGNKIKNSNWVETGLPHTPKYIEYFDKGDWYIKPNGKWTFIPNNINSFIEKIKIE
jgi:hypothetical protein